jgi:putative transposase
VKHVQKQLEVSERRACLVLEQPRSSQRYRSQPPRDDGRELVSRMLGLVKDHPRYGYRRIWALLREEGFKINRKRVYRLWRSQGLKVPVKRHKRRRLGTSDNGIVVRHRATHPDHVWAWDFIHDRTEDGRALKWLSIVDEFTRECLALEVRRSFTSEDVIDVLKELFLVRGVPEHIRSDNGPEFIAERIGAWLGIAKVKTLYIGPGSPWENGYAESFHGRVRDELLDSELFTCLAEAKMLSTQWRLEYNHRRPHSSLGYVAPASEAAAGNTLITSGTEIGGRSNPLQFWLSMIVRKRIVHQYGMHCASAATAYGL